VLLTRKSTGIEAKLAEKLTKESDSLKVIEKTPSI
jgi:hypothetical protein